MHEKRKLLLQHARSIDLDDIDSLSDRELGSNGTENVDVIFVGIDLDDLDFRMLALKTHDKYPEIAANTALEELAPEFGREDNVIADVVNRVCLPLIDNHPPTLAKDSGIHPSAGYRPQFYPVRKSEIPLRIIEKFDFYLEINNL